MVSLGQNKNCMFSKQRKICGSKSNDIIVHLGYCITKDLCDSYRPPNYRAFYLIILSLFDDDPNSPDCIASNYGMINE